MAPLEDLAAAAGPLTAWQRELLGLFMEHPDRTFRVALHTGRANGRAHLDRVMLAAELAATGHVHKYTAFGSWCVTMTGIGLLWERLAPPPPPPPPVAFTDELAASHRAITGAYGIPQAMPARGRAPLGTAPPPEAAGRDVVAEIDAVLAEWADWENGPDAYRGGG